MRAEPERFRLVADARRAADIAATLYAQTLRALRPMMPASADIRPVGATAIPGCLTKGDLDLVVRVEPADFAFAEARLAERFPRNAGSLRTTDFAAFADGSQVVAIGIQLTVKDGCFNIFHRFAEALRADPSLVDRYNALKTQCDGWPMEAYRTVKATFIEQVLAR